MTTPEEASIDRLPTDPFAQLLSPSAYENFRHALRRGAEAMCGRTMWHINTTLKGGGVAEMLSALLPYLRGAGIDCRWVVVSGSDDFLTVTKRIHNFLHGYGGDEGELGGPEANLYAATLEQNATALVPQIRAGDVVFVHDPQTAGLIPALKRRGAHVVWHCHIGTESANDIVRRAWAFLIDQVTPADRYIFSRRDYLWDGMDPARHRVIRPSIEPFSAKNQHLADDSTVDILRAAGVLAGEPVRTPMFALRDGGQATVTGTVSRIDGGPPVPDGVPIVLQASRWDRLKDPTGLIGLFGAHLAEEHPLAHLVLMGPPVDGVADDPEGRDVVVESAAAAAALPDGIRERVHLICPPPEDNEADLIVNAMQRHADVVIQKSLAEGFGLVVSEAMWKARPVVASRVGGIQDQIEHPVSGILVEDPADGEAFAGAAGRLLSDRSRAQEIGTEARARVLDMFLTPRQLTETMNLVCELTTDHRVSAGRAGLRTG